MLFAYCNTSHCITGNFPPSPRTTTLDLLKPNSAAQIESKQLNQKISHDNLMQSKQYAKDQSVLVHVYGHSYKWSRGTILRSTGPVSYIVKFSNGLIWRRHQDQLESCLEPKTDMSYDLPETVPQATPSSSVSSELTDSMSLQSSDSETPALARCYPQRTCQPP